MTEETRESGQQEMKEIRGKDGRKPNNFTKENIR